LSHPRIRARILVRTGGWSKDCIWIRSSFTMPPVLEDVNRLTVRSVPGGPAGTAGLASRDCPIASISSMKPIAPPSLRAVFLSALKNDRIRYAVIPNHIDCRAVAEMNRNGTPACFAIAFAR
jgi:hypothetical protein